MKKDGLRAWPADMQLTDDMKAFAYMHNIEPQAEYEAWQDDCAAHGRKYIDWKAAWRTRVRNAVKFNKPTGITFCNDNDGGLARREVTDGKPNRVVADHLRGVPAADLADLEEVELTLEQRRANIAKFREMVASIGKKVS